jgi:hypothetical protein
MDVYVATTGARCEVPERGLLEIGYRTALQEDADDVESMLDHG